MAYMYTSTYNGYGQVATVISAVGTLGLTAYQVYLENLRATQERHRIEREQAAAAAAAQQAAAEQTAALMVSQQTGVAPAGEGGLMATLGLQGMPGWVMPVGLGVGGLLLFTLLRR